MLFNPCRHFLLNILSSFICYCHFEFSNLHLFGSCCQTFSLYRTLIMHCQFDGIMYTGKSTHWANGILYPCIGSILFEVNFYYWKNYGLNHHGNSFLMVSFGLKVQYMWKWQTLRHNNKRPSLLNLGLEHTRKILHTFNFNLGLIFSHEWHSQLKWLVVVLNKSHVTLVANVDVMIMSSHKQWMKYMFELIIFFIYWLYNTCDYHAINDQCHVPMWYIQTILNKSNLLSKF
jgi:hypothetical protein